MRNFFHQSIKSSGAMRAIFIASLFFALHYSFVVYINSTFLENFLPKEYIGLLYSIGAIINIFLTLSIPEILRSIGNYRGILIFALLEAILLMFIGISSSPIIISVAFIAHHAINPLIRLCLDIGIEDYTDKNDLGKARGFFLTIGSLAAVISPIIVGSIIKDYSTSIIYAISIIFMLVFIFIVKTHLKKISNGTYRKIKPITELKEFINNKEIRRVGIISFLLELFYVCMIIYMPLYLKDEIGFSWGEIGIMLSIALLPFILLEIPVGEISDSKSDEKEFMEAGLLIIGISVLLIPLISVKSFILWAGILFITRIGASILEASSESYFFKKSKGKDELISVYRLTAPIAFIVGPIISSIILHYFNFSTLFIVLGITILLGIKVVFKIKKLEQKATF